ncbi:unnamed protein product, partial [Urochloa humidicola]
IHFTVFSGQGLVWGGNGTLRFINWPSMLERLSGYMAVSNKE